MKIAIASDDWETISTHLDSTKGFVIFEFEGSKIKSQEYRSNPLSTQEGGLDKIILTFLGDCDVLILKRSDERPVKVSQVNRAKIVLTDKLFVEHVLDLYLSDFLIKKEID